MSMQDPLDQYRPRPRAFRLDDANVRLSDESADAFRKHGGTVIEPQPDAFSPAIDPALLAVLDPEEGAIEIAQKRGLLRRTLVSWGGLFWSAAGGLAALTLGLWFDRLIHDLFDRSTTLGMIGLVLAGFALLALIVLLVRELTAIYRQTHIARLHIALAEARAADDRDAARTRVAELAALYAHRPETATPRALVRDLINEIVDGRDLIDIAERNLMLPLDEEARREIATAAKRVSVVTAISPRALLDMLFVVGQAMRLMRRIAEIYGGRPGFLGAIKLARSVASHLAITGGMAVGDSLVQQILGHGIAAKLSARLGEGVLNGLLTARVGLSAMAVCRPMPFAAERPPGVRDVAPFLFSEKKKD
jgi:putative membrane protein